MSQPICDLSARGYTVHRWIAHSYGGLGDVYLAKDNDCSRVAIKKIRVDLIMDPDEVAEEVHQIKKLKHPNIVQFHDTFVFDDSLWVAMRSCTFGSVWDIIQGSYPNGIPEKAASLITQQLLKAVDHIHSQGVVHRSIRASHILIDGCGTVRLSGFRYALRLGEKKYATHFDCHLESSLLYLAPEVIAQDLNGYGIKSDVYSIGITLCEIANGFPPFLDMKKLEMLYEKGRGTTPRLLDSTTLPAEDPSEHNKRLFSEAFHDITQLCLRSNPVNRPHAQHLLCHSFVKKKKKTLLDMLPEAMTLEEIDRVSSREVEEDVTIIYPEWT